MRCIEFLANPLDVRGIAAADYGVVPAFKKFLRQPAANAFGAAGNDCRYHVGFPIGCLPG